MLWFKVWCETRMRFAAGGIALGAVGLVLVGWSARWHAAGDAPQTIYLVLASVLGGGSLRQEHAHGTLGFTLALPIARRRHLAVRALAGLAELGALALLVAILTRTPVVVVLWVPCGALAFVVALGVSTAVTHEYTAWLVGFGAVMAYEVALNLTTPRGAARCDLYRIMSDGLVGAPVPWGALAAVTTVAFALFAITDRAQRGSPR